MRHFTIEEARGRIPELETIFALCGEIRGKARTRAEGMKRLESGPSADPAEAAIVRSQIEFLAGCLEQALQGIERMGATLKGLEPGLVDFPHRLADGREVYLCWREGEREITHYHGLTDGFSGRKPLPQRPVRH